MKNRYKQKLIFVIAILCLSLVSCKSKTEPINNIASWTPDDGWTINGIDIRDDHTIISRQGNSKCGNFKICRTIMD